jgi:hypothetical protein
MWQKDSTGAHPPAECGPSYVPALLLGCSKTKYYKHPHLLQRHGHLMIGDTTSQFAKNTPERERGRETERQRHQKG